jgi:hypothetical protein
VGVAIVRGSLQLERLAAQGIEQANAAAELQRHRTHRRQVPSQRAGSNVTRPPSLDYVGFMPATISGRLAVATCIACGARSRAAECPEGCVDLAIDLVEVAEIDALADRLAALEARIAALSEVAEALAAEGACDVESLRDAARAALQLKVPPADRDIKVVQAWGCPRCGRIDAPQPCLGVCVRRPVLMADASEYRTPAEQAERAARRDRALSELARLVAYVNPRPGHEERGLAALRARARALPPLRRRAPAAGSR